MATGRNVKPFPSLLLPPPPSRTNQAEQVKTKALEHELEGAKATIEVYGCGFGPFGRWKLGMC